MRKRTVNHVADTIFWYIVYFLPVIMAIIALHGMTTNDTFWYFMVENENMDGDTISMFTNLVGDYSSYLGYSALVYDTLFALFGPWDNVMQLLSSEMLMFFSYFVSAYIVHLMVDFILFIPRLTHKWMNDFTRGDV